MAGVKMSSWPVKLAHQDVRQDKQLAVDREFADGVSQFQLRGAKDKSKSFKTWRITDKDESFMLTWVSRLGHLRGRVIVDKAEDGSFTPRTRTSHLGQDESFTARRGMTRTDQSREIEENTHYLIFFN